MAPVSLKFVISFTSQDPRHPVENLLCGDSSKKWLSAATDKSSQLEAVFQLEKSCVISHIDVGTWWAFSVEIQVGRSSWPQSRSFEPLLPSCAFMNPIECKQGKNKVGLRMFKTDQFSSGTRDESWDRIRVILSQPYRKDVQYGLSVLRLLTADGEQTKKPSLASKSSASSSPVISRKLGDSGLLSASGATLMSPFRPKNNSNSPSTESRTDCEKMLQGNFSRTAKMVKAAVSKTPKYKVIERSPDEPRKQKKTFSFEDEVQRFLKKLDVKKLVKENENLEFCALRHRLEKQKQRKLSKSEKKCFLELTMRAVEECVSDEGETTRQDEGMEGVMEGTSMKTSNQSSNKRASNKPPKNPIASSQTERKQITPNNGYKAETGEISVQQSKEKMKEVEIIKISGKEVSTLQKDHVNSREVKSQVLTSIVGNKSESVAGISNMSPRSNQGDNRNSGNKDVVDVIAKTGSNKIQKSVEKENKPRSESSTKKSMESLTQNLFQTLDEAPPMSHEVSVITQKGEGHNIRTKEGECHENRGLKRKYWFLSSDSEDDFNLDLHLSLSPENTQSQKPMERGKSPKSTEYTKPSKEMSKTTGQGSFEIKKLHVNIPGNKPKDALSGSRHKIQTPSTNITTTTPKAVENRNASSIKRLNPNSPITPVRNGSKRQSAKKLCLDPHSPLPPAKQASTPISTKRVSVCKPLEIKSPQIRPQDSLLDRPVSPPIDISLCKPVGVSVCKPVRETAVQHIRSGRYTTQGGGKQSSVGKSVQEKSPSRNTMKSATGMRRNPVKDNSELLMENCVPNSGSNTIKRSRSSSSSVCKPIEKSKNSSLGIADMKQPKSEENKTNGLTNIGHSTPQGLRSASVCRGVVKDSPTGQKATELKDSLAKDDTSVFVCKYNGTNSVQTSKPNVSGNIGQNTPPKPKPTSICKPVIQEVSPLNTISVGLQDVTKKGNNAQGFESKYANRMAFWKNQYANEVDSTPKDSGLKEKPKMSPNLGKSTLQRPRPTFVSPPVVQEIKSSGLGTQVSPIQVVKPVSVCKPLQRNSPDSQRMTSNIVVHKQLSTPPRSSSASVFHIKQETNTNLTSIRTENVQVSPTQNVKRYIICKSVENNSQPVTYVSSSAPGNNKGNNVCSPEGTSVVPVYLPQPNNLNLTSTGSANQQVSPTQNVNRVIICKPMEKTSPQACCSSPRLATGNNNTPQRIKFVSVMNPVQATNNPSNQSSTQKITIIQIPAGQVMEGVSVTNHIASPASKTLVNATGQVLTSPKPIQPKPIQVTSPTTQRRSTNVVQISPVQIQKRETLVNATSRVFTSPKPIQPKPIQVTSPTTQRSSSTTNSVQLSSPQIQKKPSSQVILVCKPGDSPSQSISNQQYSSKPDSDATSCPQVLSAKVEKPISVSTYLDHSPARISKSRNAGIGVISSQQAKNHSSKNEAIKNGDTSTKGSKATASVLASPALSGKHVSICKPLEMNPPSKVTPPSSNKTKSAANQESEYHCQESVKEVDVSRSRNESFQKREMAKATDMKVSPQLISSVPKAVSCKKVTSPMIDKESHSSLQATKSLPIDGLMNDSFQLKGQLAKPTPDKEMSPAQGLTRRVSVCKAIYNGKVEQDENSSLNQRSPMITITGKAKQPTPNSTKRVSVCQTIKVDSQMIGRSPKGATGKSQTKRKSLNTSGGKSTLIDTSDTEDESWLTTRNVGDLDRSKTKVKGRGRGKVTYTDVTSAGRRGRGSSVRGKRKRKSTPRSQISENSQVTESPPSQSPDMVTCPICSGRFPGTRVVEHAATCGLFSDMSDSDDAVVVNHTTSNSVTLNSTTSNSTLTTMFDTSDSEDDTILNATISNTTSILFDTSSSSSSSSESEGIDSDPVTSSSSSASTDSTRTQGKRRKSSEATKSLGMERLMGVFSSQTASQMAAPEMGLCPICGEQVLVHQLEAHADRCASMILGD